MTTQHENFGQRRPSTTRVPSPRSHLPVRTAGRRTLLDQRPQHAQVPPETLARVLDGLTEKFRGGTWGR